MGIPVWLTQKDRQHSFCLFEPLFQKIPVNWQQNWQWKHQEEPSCPDRPRQFWNWSKNEKSVQDDLPSPTLCNQATTPCNWQNYGVGWGGCSLEKVKDHGVWTGGTRYSWSRSTVLKTGMSKQICAHWLLRDLQLSSQGFKAWWQRAWRMLLWGTCCAQ